MIRAKALGRFKLNRFWVYQHEIWPLAGSTILFDLAIGTAIAILFADLANGG